MIEMMVTGLAIDPFTNAPILILKDKENKNTLPIWIGVLEASAIAAELEKLKFSRPMTHDLVKAILSQMDIKLLRMEIIDLRDNVYYATLHFEKGKHLHKVDARPSDAIAIALRMGSPIYVNEDVFDKSKTIDLRPKSGKKGEETQNWIELLEELSPEAFGKYKM